MIDDIAWPAGVEGHHRRTARHRLDHGLAERLLKRGYDRNIGAGIELRQVDIIVDVAEITRFDVELWQVAGFEIAENHEHDVGSWGRPAEFFQRRKQFAKSLARIVGR